MVFDVILFVLISHSVEKDNVSAKFVFDETPQFKTHFLDPRLVFLGSNVEVIVH